MVYISYYRSPIGVMAMASRNNKLIGLWIKGQKNYLGADWSAKINALLYKNR